MRYVIENPQTWLVVAFCFLGGVYVKRHWFGGLVYAAFAPLLLFTIHLMIIFCLGMISLVIGSSPAEWFLKLPEIWQFLLSPSVIITAGFFVFYCIWARGNEGLPPGGGMVAADKGCANPLRRRFL